MGGDESPRSPPTAGQVPPSAPRRHRCPVVLPSAHPSAVPTRVPPDPDVPIGPAPACPSRPLVPPRLIPVLIPPPISWPSSTQSRDSTVLLVLVPSACPPWPSVPCDPSHGCSSPLTHPLSHPRDSTAPASASTMTEDLPPPHPSYHHRIHPAPTAALRGTSTTSTPALHHHPTSTPRPRSYRVAGDQAGSRAP